MILLSAVSESLNAFLFSFSGPGDFFWGNPISEKDNWERFTKGVRIVLGMGTALLVLYEIRARRMGSGSHRAGGSAWLGS